MPTVEETIAAARAKAAEHATEAAANLPTTTTASGGTAVAPMQQGPAFSMEQMLVGSISVDAWIQVSKFGLTIDKDKGSLVDTALVAIDMASVALSYTVKFGKDPAVYRKSYDGLNCAQGGTWKDALAVAQSVEATARPYRSADIPMTLLAAWPSKTKGKEDEYKVGMSVGYTTPTTGWKHWEALWKECNAKGLANSVVEVELGFEAKAKGTNEWGLVTFKLIGEHEEVEEGQEE